MPNTRIIIDQTIVSEMQRHASLAYPEESCGLLLGKFENDSVSKRILNSKRMVNAVLGEERHRRYEIDSQELLNTEVEAESGGMEIVGIYHSHTDNPARPSVLDMKFAWPKISYVIVEVRNSKSVDAKSWSRRGNGMLLLPEEIVITGKHDKHGSRLTR